MTASNAPNCSLIHWYCCIIINKFLFIRVIKSYDTLQWNYILSSIGYHINLCLNCIIWIISLFVTLYNQLEHIMSHWLNIHQYFGFIIEQYHTLHNLKKNIIHFIFILSNYVVYYYVFCSCILEVCIKQTFS